MLFRSRGCLPPHLSSLPDSALGAQPTFPSLPVVLLVYSTTKHSFISLTIQSVFHQFLLLPMKWLSLPSLGTSLGKTRLNKLIRLTHRIVWCHFPTSSRKIPSETSQAIFLTSVSSQNVSSIQPFHPLSSPSPPAPNPSQHQTLFQ